MANRTSLFLLLMVAAAGQAWLNADAPRSRDRATPVIVRVLTYNIHHGEGTDGRVDLPRLAAIMNDAAADLIALQEVDQRTRRSGGVDQLAELERLTGMHGQFGKAMEYQGGGYGVAVLSRMPARRVTHRRLPGSPDREPRLALTVEVGLPAEDARIQFTTTHLDQGRELMDQVAQASYLASAWADGGNDARILAGDMNTRPDTLTMRILARRWTDAFADPVPDAGGRPRRRIDYVMVRPAGAWRTVEARYIDAPLASDHQPVLVTLELIGS